MSETPSPSPSTSLTFEEVRVFRYYFPRLILLRGNCSGDLGGGGGELVPASSALCSPGGREEEEDQVALRFLSSAFWSLQGIPPGLDC